MNESGRRRSRHEGVSCDACFIANFRGVRYKCLVCYDYDLCEQCQEIGVRDSRHSPSHPVQAILTLADLTLYFARDMPKNAVVSLTCPACGKLGHTEETLHAHFESTHPSPHPEYVCPACAPYSHFVATDMKSHLLEIHLQPNRDLPLGFLLDAERAGALAVPLAVRQSTANGGTAFGAVRARTADTGGALSPARRETLLDPITQLLSSLHLPRRSTGRLNTAIRGRVQRPLGSSTSASGGLPGGQGLRSSQPQVTTARQAERETEQRRETRTGRECDAGGDSSMTVTSVPQQGALTSEVFRFLNPRLLKRLSSCSERILQLQDETTANYSLFTKDLLYSTLSLTDLEKLS